MMKIEIVVWVSILLALLTEIVYVWVVCKVKKTMKPIRRSRRIIYVVRTRRERPDLDFDLGVKKVDKLRFGDEA